MKLVVLSALAAIGLAAAQTVPQCVLTCSTQAAAAAGCSSYADVTCVCSSASFQNDAGACLVANCTTADQQAATELQSALCGNTTASGSVTATVASGTASTSIDTSALSSLTSVAATSSGVLTSAASSISSAASASASKAASSTGSASGASSSAASGASGAKSSVASAASSATSKAASAGSAVAHLGLGHLVGAGVGLAGVALGALAVF